MVITITFSLWMVDLIMILIIRCYMYILFWWIHYIDEMIHHGFRWYTFGYFGILCRTTCHLWTDLCKSCIGWWFLLLKRLQVRLYWEGIDNLNGDGNVGMPRCHRVTYSNQHQCQAMLFLGFKYLKLYILCFL